MKSRPAKMCCSDLTESGGSLWRWGNNLELETVLALKIRWKNSGVDNNLRRHDAHVTGMLHLNLIVVVLTTLSSLPAPEVVITTLVTIQMVSRQLLAFSDKAIGNVQREQEDLYNFCHGCYAHDQKLFRAPSVHSVVCFIQWPAVISGF